MRSPRLVAATVLSASVAALISPAMTGLSSAAPAIELSAAAASYATPLTSATGLPAPAPTSREAAGVQRQGEASKVSLTFTGNSLALYGAKAPWHGKASISIDGAPAQVFSARASSPATQALLTRVSGLSAGKHIAVIVALGNFRSGASSTPVLAVDKVVVATETNKATSAPTPAPAPQPGSAPAPQESPAPDPAQEPQVEPEAPAPSPSLEPPAPAPSAAPTPAPEPEAKPSPTPPAPLPSAPSPTPAPQPAATPEPSAPASAPVPTASRPPAPQPAPAPAPDVSAGDAGNPFASTRPASERSSYAAAAQARARASGNTAEANALTPLVTGTGSKWIGDWIDADQVGAVVRAQIAQAQAQRARAVLVAYAIPGRDCGSFSAGGSGSSAAYRAWIDAVAAGIGGDKVAVILEPDALGQLGQCASAQARSSDMRYAVGKLTSAGAAVYIDAGNSTWTDANVMAQRLKDSGIEGARGFATNVSNYNTDASERAYAERIVALLGGEAHYVIDTSRNGVGGNGQWCNPSDRRLGKAPGAVADASNQDANLFIKNPGESDGQCNGGPRAGDWFPRQALELVGRA